MKTSNLIIENVVKEENYQLVTSILSFSLSVSKGTLPRCCSIA